MTDTDPQPLVDEAKLRAYLEEHLPVGSDPDYAVERHQAGHSNETFFVSWGPHDLVLRRPPRGAFLPTAHDVLREYRVLQALEDAPARTPQPVLACEDPDVIGAEFYLMRRLRGHVLRDRLPEPYQDPSTHAAIGHDLVDALAELHTVDWDEHGLDKIGKPKGYLERQIKRWQGQWDRTRPRTEEVREVPQFDEVGDWLRDNEPETQATTLVHGDYKLDNVVFDDVPPRLIGILDWEMATLGDPLADLGWMLSFWREAEDPTDDILPIEPRITEQASFPTREALIERYEDATGFAADPMDWYVVLATWKLGILLEGSYARHLAGKTDDPFFEHMETAVPVLAERALALAHGKRSI